MRRIRGISNLALLSFPIYTSLLSSIALTVHIKPVRERENYQIEKDILVLTALSDTQLKFLIKTISSLSFLPITI